MWEEEEEEEWVACTEFDGWMMFTAPPMHMTFHNGGDTKGDNKGRGGVVADGGALQLFNIHVIRLKFGYGD